MKIKTVILLLALCVTTGVRAQQNNTGANSKDDKTFIVNGESFVMKLVEGGTFLMGDPSETDSVAESSEKPAHYVMIDSYYIGQTEVHQALWQAVMGSNPSFFKGKNWPVDQATWEECQAFVTKLNQLTGQKFRLPTEAEWEYAARGGRRSKGYKYSGSNTADDVAWYWETSGDGPLSGTWNIDKLYDNNCKTHPVATKQPNELGIYDMSGNVWEWCQDRYGSYSSESQTNPKGPKTGNDRVVRGGSWSSMATGCRVVSRANTPPTFRSFFFGLRLALSR